MEAVPGRNSAHSCWTCVRAKLSCSRSSDAKEKRRAGKEAADSKVPAPKEKAKEKADSKVKASAKEIVLKPKPAPRPAGGNVVPRAGPSVEVVERLRRSQVETAGQAHVSELSQESIRERLTGVTTTLDALKLAQEAYEDDLRAHDERAAAREEIQRTSDDRADLVDQARRENEVKIRQLKEEQKKLVYKLDQE